jgi:predicted  nucleic acid-binding Zn-ribbon protein
MKVLMEAMLQIQELQLVHEKNPDSNPELVRLRKTVPPQILGHFDRMLARGKKGVAPVRNRTCTGCRMTIPIGSIAVLMRNEDIQVCGSCGRYLYLPPEPPAEAPPAPEPKKKRGRPPKQKPAAAAE